jgi:diguanylate cyclase (GGDEF)-like protein
MIISPPATLRQMLTLPYVVLVLVAASTIGLLSYNAGKDAIDSLSGLLLTETVNRISQAVHQHVSGSEAVLEIAFPSDTPAPDSVKDAVDELRQRFWLATTIHRDPSNYAYYGSRNGEFFGLWRFSETEAELRLRTDGVSPRSIYRYSRIGGALKNPVREGKVYEPRERPWYKAGQGTTRQTWTSIYIDFKTLELVITRARRVNNAAGEFEGVVATDLSLARLNSFLRTLALSPNEFAFIVEPDGNMVATSRGQHLRKGVGDDNTRLNAAASKDPWVAATYNAVKPLTKRDAASEKVRTVSFAGPDGAIVQAGYARLRDAAGLDWIVAVAVPRSDFLGNINRNVHQTIWMGIVACLLIVAVGFGVLHVIAMQLRQLVAAAKSMGDGLLQPNIPIERNDEIGELARTFASMQDRILTDRLTGIPNREAVVRRIEERLIHHRRRGDGHPFAVLFVDLNDFKQINDQLGHEVGDNVLIEIGQRLNSNLRATDLAARYGGDEFIVLLDEIANRADAEAARTNLEESLAKPLEALIGIVPEGQVGPDVDVAPGSAQLSAGASIGLALCPDEGSDLETLLKQADEDMYARKQARVARIAGTSLD